MFVQTEVTPNPNSLKFLPGKKVSNSGPYEITNKDETQNALVRNLLSINGFNHDYGVRFLRREIQNSIEDPLSELLLVGKDFKNAIGIKIDVG